MFVLVGWPSRVRKKRRGEEAIAGLFRPALLCPVQLAVSVFALVFCGSLVAWMYPKMLGQPGHGCLAPLLVPVADLAAPPQSEGEESKGG